MTDHDLKKLTRQDLLELLIASERENEELRERVAGLEEALENRELRCGQAGTLAEASLALTAIFEEADRAVEMYTKNIRQMSLEQENARESILAGARQEAGRILAEAEAEKQRRVKEADDYWAGVSAKLESFYQSHAGLRELLGLRPEGQGKP